MTSDKARSTEARLNTMIPYAYSTLNTHTTQITTANTNITTAQNGVNSLNSNLGSSGQQAFLGSLRQAAVPGTASHTGIGTISGTPTASEFNSVNTDVNDMADLLNALIGRLQASNLLT